MLTQKVIGYKSECTTVVTAKESCFAGMFCSGKRFLGAGLSPKGVFFEKAGKRVIVHKGHFQKL